MLPVFCQFVLSMENRLAHKIWNGDCIPLLNRSISPSRRDLGWALAGSVTSLGAQKGLKLTLFKRNGERGSERGLDTHCLQLQSWGSTHIPHPGSSSRNRFLIPHQGWRQCVPEKGWFGHVGWRTDLSLNPKVRQVCLEQLQLHGYGGWAFLLSLKKSGKILPGIIYFLAEYTICPISYMELLPTHSSLYS